jgi:mRNA interferase RelE/StbE
VTYLVRLSLSSQKKLDRLPDDIRQSIYIKLEELESNPRPPGCLKMVDTRPSGWRVRVGKYRILYLIDDSAHIVSVYDIDQRDKSYKKR